MCPILEVWRLVSSEAIALSGQLLAVCFTLLRMLVLYVQCSGQGMPGEAVTLAAAKRGHHPG